jgi:hypothetical protein
MQQPKSFKLPGEWTLEELLESASKETNEAVQETDTASSIIDSDVFTFINSLAIKPGTKKVNKRLIYKLYRNWSPQHVTPTVFGQFFSMFFESNTNSYFLNLDALQIVRTPVKYIRKVKRDKTKSKNYKVHFEKFMKFYGLTNGSCFVESYVLYYMYDVWTYDNNNKAPMGSKQFFNFCEIYFEKKRLESSKIGFFGINEDIKNTFLTKDRLEIIHQWGRKISEKKTKSYQESKASKKRNKENKPKNQEPANQESDQISGFVDESESEE